VRKWEPLQRLVGFKRLWYFFWRLAFGHMLFLSVFIGLISVRGRRLDDDFWLASLGVLAMGVVFLLVIPSRGKKTALGYLDSPSEATWRNPG
jgi:site-specific recombinase